MSEDLPLLTLVKQREIAQMPHFNEVVGQLNQTLQMLCSFHSAEDLVSFLSSDIFTQYMGEEGAWVVFELGIYKDHTKTLELIPSLQEFVLADGRLSGIFQDDVWRGQPDEGMVEALQQWHNHVYKLEE